MRQRIITISVLMLAWFLSTSQTAILDSGGKLMPEQAAYDVSYYHLSLTIDPEKQQIFGSVLVEGHVSENLEWVVLDLDTFLHIEQIYQQTVSDTIEVDHWRDTGKVWVQLSRPAMSGEKFSILVVYGGTPRVARRPPWSGGIQWEETPSGEHWIATSCQGEGADIWWPVKDHVSDEPDSMRMSINVPLPLVAACNGRLEKIEPLNNDTRTYHWFISNPINVYNVALNIAPYLVIETDYAGISGDTFSFVFYVIPEDYEKGVEIFPEFQEHMHFFEELLGPYPFRADKYGVAQTPHLGMEHQSIIAYGARFNNSAMTGFDWGFDALHQHELAHEWWGNLVTNADWKDMWLHEGFGSYMQPLYAEAKFGPEVYRQYMTRMRRFRNDLAVAPKNIQTSKEIYRAPIYSKGAWFLHTLRYYLGDEYFFKCLKKMAYPTSEHLEWKDGKQTRFADTDEFKRICEEISGLDLGWLFETYLHQPKLPVLHSKISDNVIEIHWQSPIGKSFPMPVEIQMGNTIKRYQVPDEGLQLKFEEGQKPVVDPENWLLYDMPG